MAWPGVDADRDLRVACEENGVDFSRNWLVCFVVNTIAWNISAASRRMTWARIQPFETNDLGCRMPVGWGFVSFFFSDFYAC